MPPSDLANFLSGGDAPTADRSDGRSPTPAEPPPFEPAARVGRGMAEAPPPPPGVHTPTKGRRRVGDETTIGPSGSVTVGSRYEVIAHQPLPDYDRPYARAFEARDLKKPKRMAIGYICDTGRPLRLDLLPSLLRLDNEFLLKVRSFGVNRWVESGRETPILIYARPPGLRIMRTAADKIDAYRDDILVRCVLKPMAQALRDLRARRVFHGLINPSNLYRAGGETPAVLGDCVAGPAGMGQPALYETIERMQCTPAGRGAGTIADDLYAMGVSLVTLLLGRTPLLGKSDAELLDAKLSEGSFTALVGDTRLPLDLVEPIKGLLLDDPQDRWSVDDLDQWLSGRRLTPKQARAPVQAVRPMHLNGKDYWSPRRLAIALAEQQELKPSTISLTDLDAWLRRGLSDNLLADRVQEAVRGGQSGGNHTLNQRRLSRLTIALCPTGPIRYRDVATSVDGLATLLAEGVVSGKGPQLPAEIIAGNLPLFWVAVQAKHTSDHATWARQFEAMRTLLDQDTPGFGVERVLYELNPSMPCASPFLEGYYILQCDQLLRALEAIADHRNAPRDPIDRHVAAFILSRYPNMGQRQMRAIGRADDPMARALGALDVLSNLQADAKVHPLPGLCRWIVRLLKPGLEALHSKKRRERLLKDIDKQAATGLLRNLQMLMREDANPTNDASEFAAARADYRERSRKIRQLDRKLDTRHAVARDTGQQVASLLSSIVAACLLAVIVVWQAA